MTYNLNQALTQLDNLVHGTSPVTQADLLNLAQCRATALSLPDIVVLNNRK